jgi:hypothetical protein
MKSIFFSALLSGVIGYAVLGSADGAVAAPRNDMKSHLTPTKTSIVRFLRVEGRAAIVRGRLTKKHHLQQDGE